jgi:hypothetical protein
MNVKKNSLTIAQQAQSEGFRHMREKIEAEIDALTENLGQIKAACPHFKLTYEAGGDSGNPMVGRDESYWYEWHCSDCGHRWTTDQNITNLAKWAWASKKEK